MHEKTTHEGYKRAQKGSKTAVPSFNNGPDPLGGMQATIFINQKQKHYILIVTET